MQGRHFVVQTFLPALKRANIEGVTWHTLRHTFASRAVMAGVDIRSVQELMGHSTITMTMRYAHLSPAHLQEAVNKGSLGNLSPSLPKSTPFPNPGDDKQCSGLAKLSNNSWMNDEQKTPTVQEMEVLQTSATVTKTVTGDPALTMGCSNGATEVSSGKGGMGGGAGRVRTAASQFCRLLP